MKNNILYKIFFSLMAVLAVIIVAFVPMELGGDIVEYHGITDSIIKSRTIRLTDTVAYNINTYLSPEYLKDPGYYIEGVDGDRYPVHFIFYSLLAVPVRLVLHFLEVNELLSLRVTNLLLLTGGLFFIMRRFLTTNKQRLILLLLTFTSPLVSFIVWPGPDIYFLMLLLIGLFYFFEGALIKAMVAVALASWHSQPLLIVVLGMALYYLYHVVKLQKNEEGYKSLTIPFKPFLFVAGAMGIAAIPYLYNLYIFNTFSPWTILQDGWTVLNGFGLHNASLKKLIEMFFDLNTGLFWYAPLAVILGGIVIGKHIRHDRKLQVITLTMLVTAFFYQTNPAWHYGTAGFGPSKHAIFLLPLFVYFAMQWKRVSNMYMPLVGVLVIWQLGILTINGYIAPKLTNALHHSPYAIFALNTMSWLYNPTPEIFVDRTNHQDIKHPTSAVYKLDGVCKKAYVLKTDKAWLEEQCGEIPSEYEGFFDDPFKRKANFERSVLTNRATFWPDPASCGEEYITSETAPYVCMKTVDEVMKTTGVFDYERFGKVPDFDHPGIWRMDEGKIVSLTVPPGYIIDYMSFEGMYIHY